ncbi:alpha-L-fucosidase [Filimonas effusa]|uniref:alpha-L-fucosidase n=1 Tax=Filimonas effusa TaxID=2508721 RepID=A0A4Q1D9W0_9BACT|nr:alpha-L-fucosidase [Filimonas effusa]RXK85525.1 alpha-L-fucosidase [Filimonas effusa]
MQRRTLLKNLGMAVPAALLAKQAGAASFLETLAGEKMAKGPFQPTWDSLRQYQVPDWFRDAKFGIWAHWGPQCQPEHGDWYAREMYMEGNHHYNFHVKKYGHPSVFGFKDVINEWKADKWNPGELLERYKKAGAKYFVALANHHDNFDLYNSRYQPAWNSVKMGPRKDLIDGWAKAAREQGLHFGVSVHAAHTWSWMETAQRADKSGPYAGIPYDGRITKAGGKGKWWNGLDPQDLYAQNHPLSENSYDNGMIHRQWNWGNGVAVPTKEYCEKFYNRTVELINKYDPDLVYFDDTALPLWPVSDAGLRIAAHMYNRSIKNKGSLQAVINGKILDEVQRQCMVWDIERGQSNEIETLPWQTDTCLGDWHYNRSVYNDKRYKSAKTVIHTLADVVSKNGNLLLSVPVRGNGTIDDEEIKIVDGITRWMEINSEAIYGTRPWKVFGEGPAMEEAAPLSAQGFNEGKGKPFGATDIRFTQKQDALYATLLGWPENGKAVIKSLAAGSSLYPKEIQRAELLGNKQALSFERTSEGLIITLPQQPPAESYAVVIKLV